METAKVPATVFVTSGSIDSPCEFWWDDLERVLLQPTHLPKHLQLRVQGQEYEWSITNTAERQLAYKAINKVLKPLPATDCNHTLIELIDWAGLEQSGRPDYRPMTTAELIQLAQSEVIDVGAHTVTHPLLSSLPQVDQYAEIVGSRQELEAILGSPVVTFSYPYGSFTEETVEIVKAAGFRVALTIVHSAIEPGDNVFRLGRCDVNDWDGEEFKQHLDALFLT